MEKIKTLLEMHKYELNEFIEYAIASKEHTPKRIEAFKKLNTDLHLRFKTMLENLQELPLQAYYKANLLMDESPQYLHYEKLGLYNYE